MEEADARKQLAVAEGFQHLVDKLPRLLDQLVSSPARPWSDLGTLPEKGIYVFYENGSPIYVGRTNHMRARLRNHGRPSSGHESATFAFLLARQSAEAQGLAVNRTRREMQEDPVFSALFSAATATPATETSMTTSNTHNNAFFMLPPNLFNPRFDLTTPTFYPDRLDVHEGIGDLLMGRCEHP